MTKQDFIALADMIRDRPTDFSAAAIEALADFCQGQNRAFKRERWLGYIAGENGSNGGKVKA